MNVARKAVDEAISVSTNLKEFEVAMKSMGYSCNFNPNHMYWTIKYRSWKKPMRLYRMGEDYTNERIMERIMSAPEEKPFAVFQRTVYVKKQYRLPTREHKIKKVGGLKGLYLHYCYLLGVFKRKKPQNSRKMHFLLKEDLIKMDKLTDEARLLGRNRIDTEQQLSSYKESLEVRLNELIPQRRKLYRKQNEE